MQEFTGIGHVALTVSDLDRSKAWYQEVLGWESMFDGETDDDRFAFGFLPGGVGVGLHQHRGGSGDDFSHRRTGLDHLAFSVASRAVLDEWQKTFDEHGVQYTPVQDVEYGSVLNFRDPDDIALEVFAMPGG